MRLNNAMPAFQQERACKQLKFVTIVNTLNQRQSRGGFPQKKAPPRLTAKGRRQLAVETGKWDKLAGAIARILRPVEQEGI
jgi:hypothetical protein